MQTENSEINSRLKLLVDTFSGGNVAGFVRRCNLKSHQVFSRVLKIDARSGRYPKPSQEMLSTILEALPTVNTEWLYMGTGQMLKDEPPSSEKEEALNIIKGNVIPLYAAWAGTSSGQDETLTMLKPIAMLEIGGMLRDSECALCVYGDSMAPNYPEGSIIGMRRVKNNFIEPGEVYVIETADGLYLKRLYYNDVRTAYRCSSDNTIAYENGTMRGELRYQVFNIPITEVRRLYRVIGVIKRDIL